MCLYMNYHHQNADCYKIRKNTILSHYFWKLRMPYDDVLLQEKKIHH